MPVNDTISLVARAEARRMEARQRLYQAFEQYRLSDYGSAEGACPHCVTRDQFDELATTPLAELLLEQTWSYGSAVWTGISDFKYFLPRLLELVQPIEERPRWDTIERKLPKDRWSECSESEREAIAGYLAAADEYARTGAASAAGDAAELLKPMIVPARIADGLPLAPSVWAELTELRCRLLTEHVQKGRETASCAAVVVLARAVNALLDGKRARELTVRLRSVVPSDDVLLAWMRSGEAEQMMASALEGSMDDHAALCVGTALSSLASLAQADATS
jgi:hypothetical protein